jgi:lipopolysaccharide transport system permease protein
MPRAAHLFLMRELVRRDFQGRYAGSLLGFVWSFAQPLWQLLLLSFVFSGVLQVSPLGERTERFWVFLFCGLLPWLAVHEGVVRSATAITDNAHLVKNLRFPAAILVFSAVVGALLHQVIASAVFLLVLALFGELAPRGLGWLLLAIPLQIAITSGLGLLLAGVNVFLRDTAQVVGMVLAAWFYLTPVVYPLAIVPPSLRGIIEANPLTGLVGLYRAALLGGAPPSLTAQLVLVGGAVTALVAGAVLFRRLEPGFVDEI